MSGRVVFRRVTLRGAGGLAQVYSWRACTGSLAGPGDQRPVFFDVDFEASLIRDNNFGDTMNLRLGLGMKPLDARITSCGRHPQLREGM
jgi:hypothetical protein